MSTLARILVAMSWNRGRTPCPISGSCSLNSSGHPHRVKTPRFCARKFVDVRLGCRPGISFRLPQGMPRLPKNVGFCGDRPLSPFHIATLGLGKGVAIGHIGFDIEHRGLVEQVNARHM